MEEFFQKVTSFCDKHKVKVVDMNGKYKPVQRSKKFFGVIDRQVKEFNNRSVEVNNEICMASFTPVRSFFASNVENLVKLVGIYPLDFEFEEMNRLHF